jgi:hypothetical protein
MSSACKRPHPGMESRALHGLSVVPLRRIRTLIVLLAVVVCPSYALGASRVCVTGVPGRNGACAAADPLARPDDVRYHRLRLGEVGCCSHVTYPFRACRLTRWSYGEIRGRIPATSMTQPLLEGVALTVYILRCRKTLYWHMGLLAGRSAPLPLGLN